MVLDVDTREENWNSLQSRFVSITLYCFSLLFNI